MSVVAGCSLFDGAMLAADCRITYRYPDGREVHVDNGQKIFPIAPGTALGYVGDVQLASALLRELVRQLTRRHRRDPASLLRWLPRFFRAAYRAAPATVRGRSIVIMVASAVGGHINFVRRANVVKLVNTIGFGGSPIRRSWMPGVLVEILKTDPKNVYVGIPGTSAGMLYVMRPPGFAPEHHEPLQFVAIGSGAGAFSEIAKLHDMIVAGEPGNSFVEAMWLRRAVEDFVEESKIATVGGMYPVIKVTGGTCESIGLKTEIPVGGTRIELTPGEGGRWVQRNLTEGKEIALVPPWEIPATPAAERTFDDLAEAYRRFRGRA